MSNGKQDGKNILVELLNMMIGKHTVNISELSKEEAKEESQRSSCKNPIVANAIVKCSKMQNANAKAFAFTNTSTYDERNGGSGIRDADIIMIPNTFGICKENQTICRPMVEDAQWQECDAQSKISGNSSVTMLSYMMCISGQGIITPITDGQEAGNGFGEYIVDDWLMLYKNPTVSAEGRSVSRHPKANLYDWAMPEELEGIKNLNKGELLSNSKTVIENGGGKPIVNITSNNLYTDAEGRYWVAVGPNVMNPNHGPNDEITVSEMQYGTKIDILVLDETTNTQYYIPAVVGDVKGHSSPDGLYQTGKPFDTSKKTVQGDGSTVEFMGYGITKSSVNITNDYKLIAIIVYEGEVNY